MTALTTDQAALLIGVTPQAIRTWVLRGDLEPVRRGAKPLRFLEEDVVEVALVKTPARRREQLARLAAAWELDSG